MGVAVQGIPTPSEPDYWLENLKVLHLQDGDLVVFRSKVKMSHETVLRITEQMSAVIADMVAARGIRFKVIVLEEDMDLGVLRGETSA